MWGLNCQIAEERNTRSINLSVVGLEIGTGLDAASSTRFDWLATICTFPLQSKYGLSNLSSVREFKWWFKVSLDGSVWAGLLKV